MSFERLADVPVWERPQFIHGTQGPAPGGTTLGPVYPGAPAAGAGFRTVCVEPPFKGSRGGLQVHREFPPPLGPAEEQLRFQGCRPTGRRCGHPVYGGQYWECPTGYQGGRGTFIGTPFAQAQTDPFAGLGDLPPLATGSILGLATIGAVGLAIMAVAGMFLVPALSWTVKRMSGEFDPLEASTIPLRNMHQPPQFAFDPDQSEVLSATLARIHDIDEDIIAGMLTDEEKRHMAPKMARFRAYQRSYA